MPSPFVRAPKKVPCLGATLRDAITGFTGTAFQEILCLNGNTQFALNPKVGEDGKMPEGHFFDIQQLDYVDKGIVDRVIVPANKDPIPLGVKVRDRLSGAEGTTLRRILFLNGCVYYDIVPKKKSEMFDGAPAAEFMDAIRLEVIGTKPRLVIRQPDNVDGTPFKPFGGPGGAVRRDSVRRG